MNKKNRTFIYGFFLMFIGVASLHHQVESLSDHFTVRAFLGALIAAWCLLLGINKVGKVTL